MKRSWTMLLVVVIGVGVTGCDAASQADNKPIETRSVAAALTPLGTCGDVGEALREAAIREMNRTLDATLEGYRYGGNWCAEDGAYGGAPSPSAEAGGGAQQVSGTNNQVVGVDEADFVKNDNGYIYVVSGGTLRIIDAWPVAEAHEIARVPVAGTPKKLFVAGDRALVYSSMPPTGAGSGSDSYYGGGDCTYGYDCDFSGDGTRTKLSVFDLSNRAEPRLTREIDASGSYINSRRIGNAVHTVLHDQRVAFEGVSYWPEGLNQCNPDVLDLLETESAFEALRQKNTEIIRAAPLNDYLPSVVDTTHSEAGPRTSPNLLGGCGDFYASPLGDGMGFITLLSVNIADDATPESSTIVSRPGAVYASGDALYVGVRQSAEWGYGWFGSMGDSAQATTVHKFSLSDGPPKATYAASGVVKGSVLNQFSMDEHDGFLRIATTSGHVPDPDVHSTLSVVEQRGSELAQVGQIDGLAPQEDIRSVRFSGDRAFVVTFKKTDPLFVFDLSSPSDPKVLAELKIPGFSTYMHMMDDTHLLTIGYDADDQGTFAWFSGVMLQIFDVTVPTDPKLLHKEVIGTRGSSSEALTNHLAFNYFAPMNLLAFPITVCEGGSGGSYGTDMTFSGLMVYDVTAPGGFALRGKVAHPTDPTSGAYDNAACSSWWTQASSEVKRSIIMDNFIFSVSESLIKGNSLDSLGSDLVTLPL